SSTARSRSSKRRSRSLPFSALPLVAGTAPVAVRPAGPVPVAAQVGRVDGHGHHVPGARGDVAVAAGAEVRLGGLVRLDEAGLDCVVGPEVAVVHRQPRNAQATRATATMS